MVQNTITSRNISVKLNTKKVIQTPPRVRKEDVINSFTKRASKLPLPSGFSPEVIQLPGVFQFQAPSPGAAIHCFIQPRTKQSHSLRALLPSFLVASE